MKWQEIEDIICECDYNHEISDEVMNRIIDRLADEEESNELYKRLDEMNKQLTEIATCLHEMVWGK